MQMRGEEGGWDPEGYRQWLMHLFPVTFSKEEFDQEHLDVEQLESIATERVVQAFKDKLSMENAKVPAQLIAQGEPPQPAHNAVRSLIIRKSDQLWQEHLLRMDHLRSDVTLRAVGQRDPLMEFKHEAFALFDELSRNLRIEIARSLFRFEIIAPQQNLEQLIRNSGIRMERNRSLFEDLQNAAIKHQSRPSQEDDDGNDPNAGEDEDFEEDSGGFDEDEENQKRSEPMIAGPRVGRNDLCPCGSGKKYKKCCS